MKVRMFLALTVTAVAVLVVSGVVLAQHPPAFDLKFGSLSGAKEVGGGDPDGVGTASGEIVGTDTFCYALTVKGIGQPVAAHIHRGTKGRNGPVVIPFNPPNAGDPGTSSGCADGLDSALLEDLRVRPDKYYWNIHTTEFPGGAVRGQVFNQR